MAASPVSLAEWTARHNRLEKDSTNRHSKSGPGHLLEGYGEEGQVGLSRYRQSAR